MREVIPFTDRFALQEAIDNGGRFYNFFSTAGDAIVTRGELAKAAGTVSGGTKAILFLELAKWDLDKNDQEWTLDLLEPKLRDRYAAEKPTHRKACEMNAKGIAGSSVIVTGYPHLLEDRSNFNGYVMIPIMIGNITTYSLIPLYDQYNVYELFDDDQRQSAHCIIATGRGQRLDHHGPIRFGGILQELKSKGETTPSHPYFLETYFYTKLENTSL